MQNEGQTDSPNAYKLPSAPSLGGSSFDPVSQTNSLDAPATPPPKEPLYVNIQAQQHLARRRRFLLILGIAGLLLIIGSILLFMQRAGRTQVQTGSFGTLKVPLDNFTDLNPATDEIQTLKVNGQLQITNSIILAPSSQPSDPKTGQLFYDKDVNSLGYYNGQNFVLVGGGTTNNTTNVTNVLSGSGNGVQLQSTSPGVQQTGNFNVSGEGTVGRLKTTVIDSDGGTLYINPAGATQQQELAPGTPATLGLTSGSQSLGPPGWSGEMIATKATMGDAGGTATSITVFFGGGTGSGHFQVAIYEDDGDIPSKPGNLVATSAVTNLTPNSLNTATIPSVNLNANTTYWFAVNTDDNTVSRTYNGGSKASCFVTRAFGSMPDPFSAPGCFYDDNLYTVYVNYTVGGGASGGLSQALFVLGPTGQAVFRNNTDSTTAFQIQNATGNSTVLNIDTVNGRIGIGKTAPTHKLDIAAGDINLSNGRSIRFGGLQALSMNGSGDTTSITNFNSTGEVSVQAASFVVQDANAATVLLRANVAGLEIFIGNHAGDNTPVLLYLANKNTLGDPVGEEGGIYYNSSLASFRCFFNNFWHNCGDIEPQYGFSLYDEFLGGQTAFSGNIGSLGWNALAIGANGSLALNPATPTPSADRPGVLHLQTPAIANQGTTLSLGDSTGGSMIIAKDNNVKTAVAAGEAANQVIRIGLHSQTTTTTQPLSGVWWEADPSANPNWRYCFGDGAAATCTASAIAIAADSWVTLEIRVTATGNGISAATFVINNTPINVSTVTIDSTARVSPAMTCYTTTGSAQNCYWDYFQLTGTTATRR